MMKYFVTAAAAVSIAATPIMAMQTDTTATIKVAESEQEYEAIGEIPTDAEANVRGGNYFAIVVAGVVVASNKCASNAICKAAVQAIIKALGKKAWQEYYANNEKELKAKLCKAKIKKAC